VGWGDVYSFDNNSYRIALDLYKIQFEEIWHDEITISPGF
jgi:hypothetical protein